MPKQLLLADDSVTIKKVITLTFAGEDYNITTVDNGNDAITKAREIRPDIILADAVMPHKSGYEVCEVIKNDSELRSIPVLLLAGTFEPFDENEARRVGADGYIVKPFESQALIQKVKELVSPQAPAAAQPQKAAAPVPPKAPPFVQPAAPVPPRTPPASVFAQAPFIASQPESPRIQPTPPVTQKAPEPSYTTNIPPAVGIPPVQQPVSAPSVPSTPSGEELWDMGEFEETVPVSEKKEEELWEEFALEETGKAKPGEVIEAPVAEELAAEEELGFEIQREAEEIELEEVPIEPTEEPVTKEEVHAVPEAAKAEEVSPQPVTLTEEQVRVALSQVSREIIEKIVWEVVPDMAERLIKDEIERLQKKQ